LSNRCSVTQAWVIVYNNCMIPALYIFQNLALLLLRIILGFVFISYGWQKVVDLKSKRHQHRRGDLAQEHFWLGLAATIELIGGALLIIGFLTQPIALLLTLEMLLIILLVKKGSSILRGYEFELLLFGTTLLLVTMGSGNLLSLEAYLGIYLY